MNFVKLIEDSFKKYEENYCLVYDNRYLTYSEVSNKIKMIMNLIDSRNVMPKQTIALKFGSNSEHYYYSIFACLLNNLVCCFLPDDYNVDVNEQHFNWLLTDNKDVVSGSEFSEIAPGLFLIELESKCGPKELINEDVIFILTTSGSTGAAKWVLLTSQNLSFSVEAINSYMNITEEDILMPLKSFSHVSTITSELLLSVIYGACLILEPSKFFAKKFNPLIEKYKVSSITIVPTILSFMLQYKPEVYLKNLRNISVIGGPASKNLLIEAMKVLPNTKIYCGYGLTEATSRVTFLDSDRLVSKIESIGRALPGVQVRLLNENSDNEILEPYVVGEICVAGKNIMLGYLHDGAVHGANILRTKDLAYKDSEGYFYHMGRSDDVIVINGINVSAFAIEKKIEEVEGVFSAYVFVEQRTTGAETITAVVVTSEDSKVNENTVYKYALKHLKSHEVPKRIIVTSELPSISGKVSRNKLKLYYGLKEM